MINYSIMLAYEIWLVDNAYRRFHWGIFEKSFYVFRIEPYAAIGCPEADTGRLVCTMHSNNLTCLNTEHILPEDLKAPVVLLAAEDLAFFL